MANDETVDADETSETDEATQRALRFGVLMSAKLTNEHGATIAVRVRNFSETGLSVSSDAPFRIGENVQIELRDIRISGEIVRSEGTLYGIHAYSQIDTEKLAKKPVSNNAFVVSDLHKLSEKTYRPGVKRRN
jgi:PilZ domain